MKKDHFSAHFLPLCPDSSSSVSLSPAKPPHPSFYQYILTFSLFFEGGVGCWNFPGELYLREQPVPTVYIVPTGLSKRAINRKHG